MRHKQFPTCKGWFFSCADGIFAPGQAGAEQNTRIAGLEQERDSLSHAAAQHSKEMAALQAELQQLRDTLSSEKESSRKELETLQTQLREKVPQKHHKQSRVSLHCPVPSPVLAALGVRVCEQHSGTLTSVLL